MPCAPPRLPFPGWPLNGVLEPVRWNIPSAIAAALSITLAVCSPFVAAQAAAPEPRVGRADRAVSLTRALVKGVDQCFNPAHIRGNTETRNRLIRLERTALNAKSSLTSGDAAKTAQAAAELKAQWNACHERAPIVARFHCATVRQCMELGFEGHPNYPQCQPVNGNRRGNIQSIQFQELLHVLPQLLYDLSPRR